MSAQERISVHNIADLKNTSDDAIPNYLNSLKFKQDHSLVDTRLALGYGAFAIAAACFLWDYKLGFESTKWYTAAAVALYALVNGALTLWITFVEKGIVYQGTAPDGSKISISTSVKKNVPTYNVEVNITSKGSNGRSDTKSKIEFVRSFTEWFDVQGHFIAPPFQSMLATAVPLIAQADPKRVLGGVSTSSGSVAPSSAAASTPSNSFLELDAQTLDALAAAESTGTENANAGKKSKRRKA
ncbi:microsomal signal peptidase 25 kDa subunit-domain-containing protein [Xylariaceae sp. FL0594]|nr:microsomal signal peptidase 25 kDa subunit-domain-containing protein [Xylariaceae sp. FL0594]